MEVSTSIKSELNKSLKNGGVIIFVTDTVWGMGCLPESKAGVEKIYEIKKRDGKKPLILMSDKVEYLYPYTANITGRAEQLTKKYFPGGLTLVLDKSERVPFFVTAGKNTVGIRVPNNKTFAFLCEQIEGHVLATTSANISGETPVMNYESAIRKFGDTVDYIFKDGGYAASGEPSTVAGIADSRIIIFRQGSVKISSQ